MEELKVIKYDISKAAIEKMRMEYMPLTVQGLDDEAGLKLVHQARMDVKGHRVAVEKKRKELKASALEWGRKVDTEAKRIFALLEPIETHLQTEEDKVTKELERIRQEKIAAEEKRVQDIQDRIENIKKMTIFDPGTSANELQSKLQSIIKTDITEEVFQEFKAYAEATHTEALNKISDALDKAIAWEAEQHKAKEEAARLEKIRKEQEEEAARLKAIADEQAAKQKAIDDEKAEFLADLKAEQERKDREEFERKVKEDATIAAEKAEKERIEREEADRKAKAKAEAEEAARQEALRPDKEKLSIWANSLLDIVSPELSDEKSRKLASKTLSAIYQVARDLLRDLEDL